MKTWFVLLVTLGFLTGCASTAQQSAEEIYQQRQGLQQIWQGYDPLARGVGYYHANDGHIILALDTSTPPANFSQLSPGVWRSNEPFPRLRQTYYINTEFDDTTATVLRYPQVDRNPFNTLFHEDFHGYQRDHFVNGMQTTTLSRFDTGSIPMDTLVAALESERALLSAALNTDDVERREQVLLEYAGLRLWREAQLPTESVGIERRIETIEGTANWVGYRGEQQLLGYSDEAFTNELLSDLGVDYEGINGSVTMRLMTARVYSTGAALSEILTKVAEHQWQVSVEQESATLFDTLLDAFEWPQDSLTATGERFIATEEFTQAIESAARYSWPDSDDWTLDRVEREHSWKLTLYLLPTSSAGFVATSGTFTPLDDNMILLHPVSQFDMETDSVGIEINDLTMTYQTGQTALVESGHMDLVPLTLYLKEVDSSLQCPDDERSCEGSTNSISQRGLSVEGQTPLLYQLERLN